MAGRVGRGLGKTEKMRRGLERWSGAPCRKQWPLAYWEITPGAGVEWSDWPYPPARLDALHIEAKFSLLQLGQQPAYVDAGSGHHS